jgi:predicted nuclease of predicted toxin-antitoxin system
MSERIRFQADADLHGAIVKGLRRLQPAIDILAADEGGLRGLLDPEVLEKAAQDGRILVSHDASTMIVHFANFLASGKHSPGVIIIRQSVPIGVSIDELHIVWEASSPEEWIDRLEFLP